MDSQPAETVKIEVRPKSPSREREVNLETIEESNTLVKRSSNSGRNSGHLRYELVEPITHVRNRTFFEKLVSSCVQDRRTRLTMNELKAFYSLKSEANTSFDKIDESHLNLLREMWYLIYGEKLQEIKNPGWKVLGFQNVDPSTDFRGGGVLSAKNLVSFTKIYGTRVPVMTEESTEFLFGITSINVSYFLIKYYHLADYLDIEKDKADLCSRKALKNFCTLLRQDEETFDKIHAMLLNDVFDLWMMCKTTMPKITIMEFKLPMDHIKLKFVKATKENQYETIQEMKRFYDTLPNDIKRKNIRID